MNTETNTDNKIFGVLDNLSVGELALELIQLADTFSSVVKPIVGANYDSYVAVSNTINKNGILLHILDIFLLVPYDSVRGTYNTFTIPMSQNGYLPADLLLTYSVRIQDGKLIFRDVNSDKEILPNNNDTQNIRQILIKEINKYKNIPRTPIYKSDWSANTNSW